MIRNKDGFTENNAVEFERRLTALEMKVSRTWLLMMILVVETALTVDWPSVIGALVSWM